MDREKELFKIIYLLFLLGKGHQPLNGNDYLQQTMREMQNMNEIEEVNNKHFLDGFIASMEGQDPVEMLNSFLNFICNFEEFFRDPEHQFNDEMNLDLAVNMYVCCILYQMGLQFPCRSESCGPSMDVLCDMVQKQMPMLETDADAVLGQLNYSFLVFDNDGMSPNDHYIFKRMAPRRITENSKTIVKIMYLMIKKNNKAKFIADKLTGSNPINFNESAAMYDSIDEVGSFIKVIQHPFGNNGVVTLKVNVSIESTEAFLHFEEEV